MRPIDTELEYDYPQNKLLILEIIRKFTEIKCRLKFNDKKLLKNYFAQFSLLYMQEAI